MPSTKEEAHILSNLSLISKLIGLKKMKRWLIAKIRCAIIICVIGYTNGEVINKKRI